MSEPLKLLCAWCGTVIREGKPPISHGCCRACGDRMLAHMLVAEAKAKTEGKCLPKYH